jgi:two-component sensor histidine kinase
VASLSELAQARTGLDVDAIAHLQRLVGSWAMLADLSFSDLLLYAAVDDDAAGFVVLAHARSTTGPTVHPGDPVGEEVDATRRPLLARTLLEGRPAEGLIVRHDVATVAAGGDELVEEDVRLPGLGRRLVVDYVPVRFGAEVIVVMTREAEPALIRHHDDAQTRYRAVFERFTAMVADGTFPPGREERVGEFREPRVGDGVLLVGPEGRVEYASPNGVSALHRLGVIGNVEGKGLRDFGIDDAVIRRAFVSRHSTVGVLEHGDPLSVVMRCHPLVAGGRVTGGLVLLRDVSELRSRDRLLVSKDTTIREIHHRVKNNLQTIQALLRLQARRLSSPEAKAAVEQSVRRIGSIAIVHETLSVETADVVDFDAVVERVLRMVEEGLGAPERPLRVDVEGRFGELPGDVAMPLAVVLTELVQNAIDHAGPAGGHVTVRFAATPVELSIAVEDGGPGVPDGFSLDHDAGLGLTIVRTFVVHDLDGSITIGAARREAPRGAVVEIRVPRRVDALPLG